jgi:23S rRNA pseudouridine2605 synthase
MKHKPGFVALERALSKLGIASRKTARGWIEGGKVSVNGVIRKSPGFSVSPERARIEIERMEKDVAPQTFLFHKPRGVVTTHADEKGRPTVFSLIQECAPPQNLHLIAVGRLDWATSGLLLLTNDTRLSAWLTDPNQKVVRTYLVSVRGEVTDEELKKLNEGIIDRDEKLKPEKILLRKRSRKESHLTVSLTEGKNREIRRIFAHFSHEVTKLKRVAYGTLELGELEAGKYRLLAEEELRRAFPLAPIRGSASLS